MQDSKKDHTLILARRRQYLDPSSEPLLQTEFQHQQQHQQQNQQQEQKQQQAEVQIDFQIERTYREEASKYDKSKILDRAAFIKFLEEDNNKQLLPVTLRDREPADIWDNLFGNIRHTSGIGFAPNALSFLRGRTIGPLRGLSPEAGFNPLANSMTVNTARCLLPNLDKFPNGIDFRHLPPGLKLQGTTLYFARELILYEELTEPTLHVRLRQETKESKNNEKKSSVQPELNLQHYAKDEQDGLNIQAWWNTLYTSHMQHCPTDDREDLMICYENFLTHIRKLGLKLPPSPPKSSGSLPITLGYIVSLLENCSPEDRQAQLNLIPKFPESYFKSTGVIRALDLRKSQPNFCRFVHPAMGYEGSQYDFQAEGYRGFFNSSFDWDNFNSRFYPVDDYHQIAVAGENRDDSPPQQIAAIKKAFWRFIGHREALPLSFYLEAEKEIAKYTSPEIQKYLYSSLAGITTGAGLLQWEKNLQGAEEFWKEFCECCRILKNPAYFLDMIHRLRVLPPMPLFKKILVMAKENPDAFMKNTTFSMDRPFLPIEKYSPLLQLECILDKCKELSFPPAPLFGLNTYIHLSPGGQAAYEGLRFYSRPGDREVKEQKDPSTTDQEISKFVSRMEKLREIIDVEGSRMGRTIFDKQEHLKDYFTPGKCPEDFLFMLRSHETFQLNIEEIPATFDLIDDTFYPPFRQKQYDQILMVEDRRKGEEFLKKFPNAICIVKLPDWKEDGVPTLSTRWKGSTGSLQFGSVESVEDRRYLIAIFAENQSPIKSDHKAFSEVISKCGYTKDDRHHRFSVKEAPQFAIPPGEKFYQSLAKLKCAAFHLLENIQNNSNLSKNSLETIFAKIKEIAQTPDHNAQMIALIGYLETHYSVNFPPGYLYQNKLTYQIKALRKDIADLIEQEFEDKEQCNLVTKLLSLHDTRDQWGDQKETIRLLKHLSSLQGYEKTSLNEWLYQILDYEQAHPNNHTLAELNRLFAFLHAENNPLFLESLIYRKDTNQIPNLVQTCCFLQEYLYPWLKKNALRLPQESTYSALIEVSLGIDPTKIDEALEDPTLLLPKKDSGELEHKENKDKKINIDHAYTDKSIYSSQKNWQDLKEFNRPDFPEKKYAESFPLETKNLSFISNTPTLDVKDKSFVSVHKEIPRNTYQQFFLDYYDGMYTLAETYPCIKKDLVKYISHFAKKFREDAVDSDKKHNEKIHLIYIRALREQLLSLEEAAQVLQPTELRHLLYNYHQEDADPNELITMLHAIEEVQDQKNKKTLYQLLSKLSGEKIPDKSSSPQTPIADTDSSSEKYIPILDTTSFSQLCKLANQEAKKNKDKETAETAFNAIEYCYQDPPYVPLQEVLSWSTAEGDNEAKQEVSASSATANIRPKYDERDSNPLYRNQENIFDLEKAKQQAKLFRGPEETVLTENIVTQLSERISVYRAMSTRAKIAALQDLKQKIQKDRKDRQEQTSSGPISADLRVELTALLGELLYGTTWKELNYTQYLTLYSCLSSNSSVTHQVETGGGKSRITMALCAGLHILGKSVEFVTKNWDLAEREFYGFRHFFQACKIPRQLIDVHTPAADYLGNNQGINFSSKHQLALFHNKVCTEEGEQFFGQKDNRVVVVDEAHTLYYDSGREHVIFSAPLIDPKLRELAWLYPWISNFIKRDGFRNEYLNENTDYVFDCFRNWIKTNLPEAHRKVKKITNNQLEVWFRSANIVEYQMQEGIKYDATVGCDRLKWISRRGGLVFASSAVVKTGNALAWESTFTDGVQQFLHVKLNHERNQKRREGQTVSKTPHEVEEESFPIFDSTMATLLNRSGTIFGFTATSGSIDKRTELSKYAMQFVDVPPQKPSLRTDLPIRLTADEADQMAALYQEMREAVRENRPVLIVCEDDNESQRFLKYCQDRYTREGVPQEELEKLQRVDSNSDMKAAVKRAGEKQVVTITTDIMGCGTDIVTKNTTKGLRVCVTYLPNKDDMTQIFGRAGRYGKPGDARLVLDIQRLRSQLKIPYNARLTDQELIDLSLTREVFIAQHQARMDWNDQDARAIYLHVNALGDKFTQHFFAAYHQKGRSGDLLQQWVALYKKLKDDIVTPELDTIHKLLQKQEPGYQQNVISRLNDLMEKATTEYCTFFQSAFHTHLDAELFKPTESEIALLKKRLEAPRITLPLQPKTYSQWEPAHAGGNFSYHKLFAHTRAVLNGKDSWTELFWRTDHRRAEERNTGLRMPELTAWTQNKRLLFANTRAFFAGDLNKQREQLNQAMEALYAALLTKPEYKKEVQSFLEEISQLCVGAEKKRFEWLINIVQATTNYIKNPQEHQANYQMMIATIQSDRRWQRLKDALSTIITLGITLTCSEVATTALALDMPHAVSFDFSNIPADVSSKLALAGGGLGCLLIIYLIKSFATNTEKLQSTMNSVEITSNNSNSH